MIARALAALVLAMAATVAPAQAPDLPALHDVTGVAADDVLNIRAAPSAGAPIVGSLDPEARGVEVVERQGSWGRVNTQERSGWASLRFLQPQPEGRLPEHDAIRCFGTEPFWNLDIAAGELAAFGALGIETRGMSASDILVARARPGPFIVLGSDSQGDMTLVMALRQCSDGMSDRLYGLDATLVLTGAEDGPAVLSGCCTLAAR